MCCHLQSVSPQHVSLSLEATDRDQVRDSTLPASPSAVISQNSLPCMDTPHTRCKTFCRRLLPAGFQPNVPLNQYRLLKFRQKFKWIEMIYYLYSLYPEKVLLTDKCLVRFSVSLGLVIDSV